MKPRTPSDRQQRLPEEPAAQPREDMPDSGWGEGSASALETLRRLEKSRSRTRTTEDKPSAQ